MPQIKTRSPTLYKVVGILKADGFSQLADYIEDLGDFINKRDKLNRYQRDKGLIYQHWFNRDEATYFSYLINELEHNNWLPEEIIDGVKNGIAHDIEDAMQWQRR